MERDLLELLEQRLDVLLADYVDLQHKYTELLDGHQRLLREREEFKGRIDALLGKLEGI